MKSTILVIFILTLQLSIINIVFSQDLWTGLSGPYGGGVEELKKHTNGNLYALRNDDLYSSSDNAESWNKIDFGFNSNLCMDVSSSGTIFIGKSSGGLWWSVNNGTSWDFNPIHIGPHGGQWASVVIVKVSPAGQVYINNHVSLNGGSTFNDIVIGPTLAIAIDYAFNNSSHVYASVNTGIYYSINNGSSWTNVNGNLPSGIAKSLMFNNDVLYAAISANGIFKTTNNGIEWTSFNNGLTDLNIVKLKKDDMNNYFAASESGKVFKSTDQGTSWIQIHNGNSENLINTILAGGNSIYLGTSSLGILKSNDNGVTWNEKNKNLFLSGIHSLDFSGNHEIYAASHSGLYYSSNDGESWERRVNSLPTSIVYSVYKGLNFLLAGLRNSGIYKSFNNGLSWQPANNGLSLNGIFEFIESSPAGFIFAANIPLPFTDTLKLYRSSDNGDSWTKVLQPQSNGMSKLTMDVFGNIYVAGTNISFETSVLRSTDNGNNWSEFTIEGFFLIQSLTSSGTRLYMTASGDLFKSTNMGEAWEQIQNGSWQTFGYNAVAVNSIGNIYASVSNEIYLTTNTGTNWQLFNSGITPFTNINNFRFDGNEFLYGVTYFDGIFKTVNSTLTNLHSVHGNLPESFTLKQNYPNPFNPTTKINYELRVTNYVSLKVYNSIGKHITTLVSEKLNAGSYEIDFKGENYPSGIYYYTLEAGEFKETKSMVLIK